MLKWITGFNLLWFYGEVTNPETKVVRELF